MMMQRSRVAVWAAGMLALAAVSAQANNLQITNVTVTGRDDTTAFVQFDISWENSWRYAAINHDAAWVFFKVLPDGQTDWQHVTLEGTGTTPTNYNIGSGTPVEMIVPADRVGMFVRRSGDGAGTTLVTNVKAVWNIASNSLSKADKVKLQAFGVEMVYVAEGDFAAGSGGSESGAFTLTTINTANATVAPSGSGSKGGQGGGYPTGQTAPANATWPNGYAAFYCMKYSITQGQYADFLNALTRDQQTARCTATILNYYMCEIAGGRAAIYVRNTVRLTEDPGSPSRRVYTTVTHDRACNWLTWADGVAFADWGGLRPITELEYEKACRGPLAPVPNEYAWGSTVIAQLTTEAGDGTGTSRVSTVVGANCLYGNSLQGPCRVGIFATASSTREQAGASYWGIMELSGNLNERAVTIGNATGRGFTGLHGNGILANGGDADVTAWAGVGFRGGNWYNASTSTRVSDRSNAADTGLDRLASYGSRAVRSAPSGVEP